MRSLTTIRGWFFILGLALSTAGTAEAAGYFWTTPFCEFGVVFPSEPRQYKLATQYGPSAPKVDMIRAELETDGLYRAECAPAPPDHLDKLTHEDYIGIMEVMADSIGLGVRSFHVEELPTHIQATLTGLFEVEGERVTMEITTYMAPRSMFILTRGQLTGNWSSTDMRAFKESVQMLER